MSAGERKRGEREERGREKYLLHQSRASNRHIIGKCIDKEERWAYIATQ